MWRGEAGGCACLWTKPECTGIGAQFSSSQPIPALPRMSALMNDAIRRHIYDLDKFRPRQLQASLRSAILRITGNPKRIQPERTRKRHQQPNRPARIMVPAILLVDAEADMSRIPFDMRSGSDSQVYRPQFLSRDRVNHPEMICRDSVYRMWSESRQLQPQFAILKRHHSEAISPTPSPPCADPSHGRTAR